MYLNRIISFTYPAFAGVLVSFKGGHGGLFYIHY